MVKRYNSQHDYGVVDMKKFYVHLCALLCMIPVLVWGAPSAQDQAEIEAVVAKYLKDNPKVVFDALMAYRNQEMQKMEDQSKKNVVENFNELFNDKSSPSIGPDNAKVKVVEFMDYQCGHCRVMGPRLETLTETKDVKLIVKLLPIRGQSSLYASKLALAAQKQGKFKTAHHALMDAKDISTEAKVDAVLAAAGIDVAEAKKYLNDYQKDIDANFALASKLKLQGTPALIFANGTPQSAVFIPGAIDQKQLNSIVANLNA